MAFAGAATFLAALLQWNALHEQLDAIESDRRPWLTVDLTIPEMRVADTGDMVIEYAYTVKNTGRSPAQHIQNFAAFFSYKENYQKRLDQSCAYYNGGEIDPIGGTQPQQTLFPGGVVSGGEGQLIKKNLLEYSHFVGGDFGLNIIGCLRYVTGTTHNIRLTRYSYDVRFSVHLNRPESWRPPTNRADYYSSAELGKPPYQLKPGEIVLTPTYVSAN